MKISIIIPTHRRIYSFQDTFASVLAQDFPPDQYEILVVDNAAKATPQIASVCESSGQAAVHYIHESHNGLHHARHAGARAAKGDVLAYIDDDVLCPPGWLSAMFAPYQDPRVGMVAGKVVLRYEMSPPEWLGHFADGLSALDWGDEPHVVEPYGSPVGCNMSIRRSVLYEVGGFNPDAFGDRSLIHLRGDGEYGLAHKVHDTGWTVWYAPQAWLEHRVPAGRMTEEYVKWRSGIGGIEEAYTELRYHQRTVPGLFLRSCKSALCHISQRLRASRQRHEEYRRIQHGVNAERLRYRGIQQLRQAFSTHLRRHTTQAVYLNAHSDDETKVKRIAFFWWEGYLGIQPDLMSAMRLLSDAGYDVDLITRRPKGEFAELPDLGERVRVLHSPEICKVRRPDGY